MGVFEWLVVVIVFYCDVGDVVNVMLMGIFLSSVELCLLNFVGVLIGFEWVNGVGDWGGLFGV